MTSKSNAPRAGTGDAPQTHGRLWGLVLGSIGVVYGDIGTSPLYALRESLVGAQSGGLEDAEIIGIVSLLLWTLILIVSFKYVALVLRADNRGEGGTLSLVALARSAVGGKAMKILAVGVVGMSLFFGDAMITPAISVLSAVEGLELVTPALDQFVLPIALMIIAGIFWVQHKGTEKVSRFFGPITLLWFFVMAILGMSHIGDQLQVLHAVNPVNAIWFLAVHGATSLPVMGSVFLAVTGAEALYADMGHFGRRPIRIAWNVVVFPALMLSYLGQGALVLSDRSMVKNPFFLMAPDWFLLPLVLLATAATVIASQAVISGAFSMARQAVQMGLLPRLEVRHTSESQFGQIYMPQVNKLLFVGVVALVLTFRSSANLASAYGIAVTGDMVITSILSMIVFRKVWKWSPGLIAMVWLPLLTIESLFLFSNLAKVVDGGWVPLLFAASLILTIWTWIRGTAYVQMKSRSGSVTLQKLVGMLSKSERLSEAPGTAVFLTADPDTAPSALMHNIKHNHVLHKLNLIVTVGVADTPYVGDADRLTVEPLDERFTRVQMHFGYMEEPNVPKALMLARKQGVKFDIMSTSFFLNRRSFRSGTSEGLPTWQEQLFVSLTKSASNATDFYRLPTNRVIELGQQLAI